MKTGDGKQAHPHLAVYDQIVASLPGVERKGATLPYTAVNGNMFSFLTRSGTLAIRLPADVREAFMKQHNAKLCVQHGSVLKEYVEVPEAMMSDTHQLRKYLIASHAYALSLKSKKAAIQKPKSRAK